MGTTTTNLGLYKPLAGEVGWASLVNANFDKLDAADANVQHVHPNGDDANDGLTWGTAKETVLAAYDDLPAAGDILIAPNSQVGGEVSGQGLWLVGSSSAHYASPPSGFRQASKKVRFIGVGGSPQNEEQTRVQLEPGTGQTSWGGPWIWLDYVQVGVQFINLSNQSQGGGYGIDMSRSADGSAFTDDVNCAQVRFQNVHSKCTRAHMNNGYNALRSVGSFWVDVEDVRLETEPEIKTTLNGAQSAAAQAASEAWTVTTGSPTDFPSTPFTAAVDTERVRVTNVAGTTWTVTRGYLETDARAHGSGAEVRVDPDDEIRAGLFLGNPSSNANYLWRVKRLTCVYSNVRAESTTSSYFEAVTLESCSGAVIFFYQPGVGNVVDGVNLYDQPSPNTPAVIHVHPPNTLPSLVQVRGAGVAVGLAPQVYGPATVLGDQHVTPSIVNGPVRQSSPAALGSMGFHDRKFYGQVDTARRAGLSIAHHANLASQDETTWNGIGDGTAVVTTGQADVFGLSRAAGLAGSDTAYRGIYSGSWSPSAPAAGEYQKKGDFVFYGAWLKSNQGWVNAAAASAQPLQVEVTAGNAAFQQGPFVASTGAQTTGVPIAHAGNLDWQWFQGFAKVSTAGASTIKLRVYFNVTACYPVLFTAASLTDAEAWELFHHMTTYPDTAAAGQFALPRGSSLQVPESYIELGNISTPSAPASSRGRLYVDTSGGKQRLMVLFDSGAAQVIATEP